MKIEELRNSFWDNGFLIMEDVFETGLMDNLNNLILEHFGMSPEFRHTDEFLGKAQTEVIPWFPQQEGVHAFDEVEAHPFLNTLTNAILGEGWQKQYCMVMFSKEGTRGQAWHQDCPPDDPNQHNLNRLVYTMDITPEVGGQTVVVPGTHRRGVIPVGEPDGEMEGQVVLEPKKGTVILLHGHTWHRVLPIKGQYRVSTNYRSAPQGTPEDITDVCVYRNMRYRFSTSELIEDRTTMNAD